MVRADLKPYSSGELVATLSTSSSQAGVGNSLGERSEPHIGVFNQDFA